MDFCGIKTTSRFFLAPLAGYTDAGFRALAVENGAALTYTEMVSAKGMCYGSPGTEALLYVTPAEKTVAVQLFGSDPEFMRRAASDRRLARFDIVDINMGCPVKKIFSSGDGSALMKDSALIEDVVRATVEGAKKPVTVKMRAGITVGETVAVKCAEAAVRGGAAAIAVHPRFREQMYGGSADHTVTAAVKEAVGVPVIASGDITDAESFLRINGLGGIRTRRRRRARRVERDFRPCAREIRRVRCRKTPPVDLAGGVAAESCGKQYETAFVPLRHGDAERKTRARGSGVGNDSRPDRRRRREISPPLTAADRRARLPVVMRGVRLSACRAVCGAEDLSVPRENRRDSAVENPVA